MHKVGFWMHICIIRAYRVCRDQHHLDICSPRVDRGVFSLVGVVVERRGVVFFLVGATREGWVMCWGAGGWVLLSPVLRVRLSTRQQNGCGCLRLRLPLPDHLIHHVTLSRSCGC